MADISVLWQSLSLIMVALLWGATNPLMKRGGEGIQRVQRGGRVAQFLAELKFLILNWKYILPFLVNQSGSVLFYLTLASAELSLAVPITNALTFIFTTLTGKMLGEDIDGKETYVGMALVVAGVTLCVWDKT
ncbi:transmembrane protein 234-like [Acanthaster planci]|uniref:Transmembrane protein 234-like n=1 Tax=Acanthaster planci TaxID=133434 RepID=A0A8B7YNL9_ACAPL|nr:transmembrane protein 234-like [Acanthaster planci]XP_022094262.1 transmembrane protein 234-like [Acanthaster planci]